MKSIYLSYSSILLNYIFFYVSIMSNNQIPIVKPINIPEYKYKQSKYDMVPRLPFRSIIVASSDAYKKAGSYERTPRATTQHVEQAFQTFEIVASTLVALYSTDTFERMVTLGGKTYGKPDASMQSQCRVFQQSVQRNGLYVPCPGEDLRFPYMLLPRTCQDQT